ncbi:33378_t:CDS:10 [Gigaspora margarita]|uniref:33378_t:CDS:1 n=1 Tax=Gigaspora margarita TaxID=4874 RepID=A0ABM8VYJ8_GIGMA|nr:33378_t:CDS:10 [Gigaspora margarita]
MRKLMLYINLFYILGKSTDLEAKNQQKRNGIIKGKRVALEAEVEQKDEDIKGKLTVIDAENQILRDKVIRIEERYNKYRELTTLYCKSPNIKIPEDVKKILDTLEKNNNDLADRLQDLVSHIQVLKNKAESSESCLPLVESLSHQVTELEAENTMLKKEKTECIVSRRIENNILQENMNELEKQVISKDSIISENEKSYEEKQQYYSNRLRIERVQVIEYLLRRYKKELEQAQSNHNHTLEDQYNSFKVIPNTIKILQCIEELQESINELQNEKNGSLQKNEAILKDTIFVVKKQNQRLSKILKVKEIFEIAIQKYEEAVNNLGYRIEVSGDNEVHLKYLNLEYDSDSDMSICND